MWGGCFRRQTFLPTKQRSRQAEHFDQRLTKAQKCAIGNSRWRSKRVGDKTEQLLVCLGSAIPKWRSTVSRLKLRTLDGWYCYIWGRRTASGISCRRKGWYSSPLENVLWLAFFILIYINTLKNILGLCAEYKGNFFGVWKVFRGITLDCLDGDTISGPQPATRGRNIAIHILDHLAFWCFRVLKRLDFDKVLTVKC